MSEKYKGAYPKSKNFNFEVIDSIGVPHPYCIGHKHIAHAADHFGGILSTSAIEDGEKHGIVCAIRGCNLSYAEHEQALVVKCYKDFHIDENAKSELHSWLFEIKDTATNNGYAGFAFIEA